MQVGFTASMLSALVLCGCGRPEIHAYRVPKVASDAGSGAAASAADGSAPFAGANPELPRRSTGTVAWTVPPEWRSVASDQPMRLATFDAGGAEVTVAAFPGAVGGNLANVNRWRGQIGLDPVDEPALGSLLSISRSGTTEVAILAMEGKDGKVMLGAIVTPGDGQTWFVKSVTDAARAQALRPAFEAFARSFTLTGAASASGAAAASASASASPSGSTAGQGAQPDPVVRAAASAADGIDARLARFTPPSGWTTQVQGGGGIVAASFTGAGGARITATRLANDGGGDLANINRWRGQLGLAPLADLAAVERCDIVPGLVAVDLRDAKDTDRMITVIAPAGGATWFFKLRGTVAAVESERAAFAAFVREVAGTPSRVDGTPGGGGSR